jgi:xanthine dehydrogenase YagS FAD-binding subunit
MQTFELLTAENIDSAIAAAEKGGAAYIAGGTDLLQLMKDNVAAPRQLIDIAGLPLDRIETTPDGLRLGALVLMSDAAAHPAVRENYPAISQALLSAASPQIRNMGTIGGNLLQRTRCGYFRDTGFACNKRNPGSGCPAINGENRMLSILGGSQQCIATHPSDLPVALTALDAVVALRGPNGAERQVPITEFYRLPGDAPQIDTVLAPGELVTSVLVPPSRAAQRSRYVKVRDRASFEFALVSAAVALETDGGIVREARVAAGGVAPRPWRLPQVEAALRNQPATEQTFRAAADLAPEGARPASQNAFKAKLMQRVVARALIETAA